MELAPIEYMKWPNGVPKPHFDEVQNTALACMNLCPDELLTGKTAAWVAARQLVAAVAQRLLSVSQNEVRKAMGLGGCAALRDRPDRPPRQFMETNAGVAMVNEVTYCLLRDRLNHVAAERRKSAPPPGEYREKARQSLRGHAGGAI